MIIDFSRNFQVFRMKLKDNNHLFEDIIHQIFFSFNKI
jgi:hypothetical protein